jgi:hypothetical protein
MWLWGNCARFFLLVYGRPLTGRRPTSCFSHFLYLLFPFVSLPGLGFLYRVMVFLFHGTGFGLTGFGLLVVGMTLVFGEVFFRLFADLRVGVTAVGGGTYIFLTIVFLLDSNLR